MDEYMQMAVEWIERGRSLFVSGKAGTGKTFFLRELKERMENEGKYVAVLAPTGVAANNAGGVTIHSFLRIPTTPYFPGVRIPKLYRLKKDERDAVRMLDMLLIDEVSMVRADLMDAVDDIMRYYREDERPFGGVQVVLFGDLFQLEPVVKEEDRVELEEYYSSMYFFDSRVMQKMKLPNVELQNVVRQKRRGFIKLLNHVRNGRLRDSDIDKLKPLYNPNFRYPKPNDWITLTTHNWKAKWLNNKELRTLPGELRSYEAVREGWFPKEMFPTKYFLELKVGARVMFVKNDNNDKNDKEDKRFYNGKLATVVELSDDWVCVEDDEGQVLTLGKEVWRNESYYLDKTTNRLCVKTVGSFTQFPLQLAWAVTIHKSQGLTFDKVVIDAGKAFAAGQVYVALSRCRTLENIVLLSRIKKDAVMASPLVWNYKKTCRSIEDVLAEEKEKREKKRQEKVKGKLSKTVGRTLEMIEQGMSVKEIAMERSLNESTIWTHIAELVERGVLSVEDYVGDDALQQIRAVIEEVGADLLTPIKDVCGDDVSFNDIKLVIADYRHLNS